MSLCQERRGVYIKTEYISKTRVIIHYKMPFAEIVYDFYDKLKSITRGYGTLDYHTTGYEPADLCRLRILVAGDEVDALSIILHKETAESKGRKILKTLKKEIHRQLFEIALQAAIGGKIIAREDIGSVGKNVIAKCYGGDITPQAQAAGEAEGRQEADEERRQRRDSAGRVHGRPQVRGRRRMSLKTTPTPDSNPPAPPGPAGGSHAPRDGLQGQPPAGRRRAAAPPGGRPDRGAGRLPPREQQRVDRLRLRPDGRRTPSPVGVFVGQRWGYILGQYVAWGCFIGIVLRVLHGGFTPVYLAPCGAHRRAPGGAQPAPHARRHPAPGEEARVVRRLGEGEHRGDHHRLHHGARDPLLLHRGLQDPVELHGAHPAGRRGREPFPRELHVRRLPRAPAPPPPLVDGASGDRIMVTKYFYAFSPVERYDVLVFKFPLNQAEELHQAGRGAAQRRDHDPSRQPLREEGRRCRVPDRPPHDPDAGLDLDRSRPEDREATSTGRRIS